MGSGDGAFRVGGAFSTPVQLHEEASKDTDWHLTGIFGGTSIDTSRGRLTGLDGGKPLPQAHDTNRVGTILLLIFQHKRRRLLACATSHPLCCNQLLHHLLLQQHTADTHPIQFSFTCLAACRLRRNPSCHHWSPP